MPNRVAGRVAGVTGGNGLGAAIAELLGAEGADIAVADLAPMEETGRRVSAMGRRYFSAICDISKPDQIQKFAAKVREALGFADIVVDNAVMWAKIAFEDLTIETVGALVFCQCEWVFPDR